MTFTFPLTDIGRTSGEHIQVSYETQGGVPGQPDVGIADHMPDSGFFGYVLS